MVVHTCHVSTQKAGTEVCLWIQSQTVSMGKSQTKEQHMCLEKDLYKIQTTVRWCLLFTWTAKLQKLTEPSGGWGGQIHIILYAIYIPLNPVIPYLGIHSGKMKMAVFARLEQIPQRTFQRVLDLVWDAFCMAVRFRQHLLNVMSDI